MTIAATIAKMLGKNADEISEEAAQKLMKSLGKEASDAPTNLIGKGANLDALQRASDDIADNARKLDAPSYPANVVGGDKNPNFVMQPEDPGFTMPHPEAQVPALRKQTLPEVVEAESIPMQLPAVRQNNLPAIDAESNPITKNSNMLRNLLAGGTVAGGTAALMMGDTEKPAPAAQQPSAPSMLDAVKNVPKPTLADTKPSSVSSGPINPAVKPNAEEVAPTEAPVPKIDYMKLLADAQNDDDFNQSMNKLASAGSRIGHAIARVPVDEKVLQDRMNVDKDKNVSRVKNKMNTDMEDKKLKSAQADLEDEDKLRDPNSDISKTLREMAHKLGYKFGDKTSGKNFKDMGINVAGLIAQKEAREQAALLRQDSQGNANKERTKSEIFRGMTNWDKSDSYKAYQSSKAGIEAIDDAMLTGDKIAAGTAFMRFAKTAQGDDSVVKSEDMKTLLGGTNYSPKAYASKMADLAKGKNVTDAELKAMRNIMGKINDKERQKAHSDLKPHLNKMEGSGLDTNNYIDQSKLDEITGANKKAPAGGMVKVTRISDGASKMMSAEQAAKADKTKYTVGN